jgi:hypothetical protein
MFETTSKLAETVANSVSRRGFLGSLGGWAATAALGVAGVLSGGSAWASGVCNHRCCVYTCGPNLQVTDCNACPPSRNGCPLSGCFRNHGTQEGCFC